MPLPFHRTYTFTTQVIGMWRRNKRHLFRAMTPKDAMDARSPTSSRCG